MWDLLVLGISGGMVPCPTATLIMLAMIGLNRVLIGLYVIGVFSVGLALMLMAGLREKLELAQVPSISQGAAMSLMLAGLLSLAFMGFAGLGGGHG